METGGYLAWCMGKFVLGAMVAACLLGNITWLFKEKQNLLTDVKKFPGYVLTRITTTYLYLVISLLLTCISISYVFQSPFLMRFMVLHPNFIIISTVIIMTILTSLLELIPYEKNTSLLKKSMWFAHSVAMGPSISYFGSYICSRSALSTALGLMLATAVSYLAPKSVHLYVENKLNCMYISVTAASLLCVAFSPPTTSLGIIFMAMNFYGGMVLYFSVFITNTQYFLKEAKKDQFDPVYTACVMYLCVLNFYTRIAMYNVVELTNLTDTK